MVVPALLFLCFSALAALGLTRNDPGLLLLGASAAFAALILLVRGWRNRSRRALRFIIVDGSNVLHWQENKPQLASLRAVLAQLQALGYTPGVVFDANAGYKIAARYQQDFALAKLLRLPTDRVLIAPRGTPADPLILESARDLGAPIVSNDRFRDWAEDYPEVTEPGRVIGGGFRDGKLWLDME